MKKKVVLNSSKTFHRVVCNLKPKDTRIDNLQGKDYLVVPMVMLVEGVHNGSEGAFYYPAKELKKRTALWNSKPIVVYHPSEPSACSPLILNTRGIGTIMNTVWSKGKLTAEAWLDKDRVDLVDGRILESVENEEILEVSTGLFADSDETPGEWKEEEYIATLSNYGPDHLAILPDQVGACSIEDGAGLYRNQANEKIRIPPVWLKRFENEQSANELQEALNEFIYVDGEYNWVEDIFDTYFIYSSSNKLFKRDYKADGDVVTVEGLPEEVERKISYPSVVNKKTQKSKSIQIVKGNTMNKKDMIEGLIANKGTQWEEDDREFLNGLKDEQLEKLVPVVVNKDEKTKSDDQPKPQAKDGVVADGEKVENKETSKVTSQTEDEYLNSMPPAFRRRWETLVRNEDQEKTRLIEIITKNEKNTFTPEWLKQQDVEMLQNLARLADDETQDKQDDIPTVLRFNYEGQGDPIGNDDTSNVPALGLPVTFKQKQEEKTA